MAKSVNTINVLQINGTNYSIGQRWIEQTGSLSQILYTAYVDTSFNREVAFANTTDYGVIALFGEELIYDENNVEIGQKFSFIASGELYKASYSTTSGATVESSVSGIAGIEDITAYTILNASLYTYIQTRYTDGDHRPFFMNIESVANWVGSQEQVLPEGRAFGWYDATSGDIIVITNCGISAIDNTYETRPIVNYNSLAERVIYDNSESGLEATNVQEALDETLEQISHFHKPISLDTKLGDLIIGKQYIIDWIQRYTFNKIERESIGTGQYISIYRGISRYWAVNIETLGLTLDNTIHDLLLLTNQININYGYKVSALDIGYDGSSGLEASNVEEALDELNSKIGDRVEIANGTGVGSLVQKDKTTFVFENPNSDRNGETVTVDATGEYATSLGGSARAEGKRSVAEGTSTIAQGGYSHAEGNKTITIASNAHAEGLQTVASGVAAHSEGELTVASGEYSHAEGVSAQATSVGSHAEGNGTRATDDYAHAEGNHTEASGAYAHAEGHYTVASGWASHAEGINTYARYTGQTVVGQYNKNKADTLFEVGNGTDFFGGQSNAFEVYKDGHAEVQTIGTTDNSIITKGYVDPQILEIKNALYGSILAVENQNYVNVGWGIFDRVNGYPIVNNQKAQITSVKGRTLIANQLFNISGDNRKDNVSLTTNVADNSFIISITATSTLNRIRTAYSIGTLGNKYLISYKAKYNTNSQNASLQPYVNFGNAYNAQEALTDTFKQYQYIMTCDYNGVICIGVLGGEVNDEIEFKDLRITDLKKMGIDYITSVAEFNNLTHNWLSSSFDAGTIKPTNFFQINKKGFNDFDEEWEIGGINAQGVVNSNVYNARSKNYISVICGQNYTISNGNYIRSGTTEIYVVEYDENYTSLRRTSIGNFSNVSTSRSIQLLNETKYIKFFIFIDNYNFTNNFPEKGNWCFHLTGDGSMNGIYKPYNTDTVDVFDIDNIPTLQGVGTAQDEKTLTQDIKRIGSVDLGTLGWTYQGDGLFNATTPIEAVGTNTATPANLLCVKYTSGSYYDVTNKKVDKQITFNKNNKLLYIMDTEYTDVATFKQSLSGQKLYFERSMPIILRKYYTAKVDLGTLIYLANQVNYGVISTSLQNIIKKPSSYNVNANIVCSKYETVAEEKISTTQNAICITTGGNLIINDTNLIGKTNAETQAYLSGVILYYETTEKVSTPLPEIGLGEVIIDNVERFGTFEVSGECIADFEIASVVYKPIGE